MTEEARRARAQRAYLETKLAWGDKQPEVKPPVVRKRIKYLSDDKKKGE